MTMRWRMLIVLASMPLVIGLVDRRDASGRAEDWSPTAAAAYLDQRQQWWATWPNAARDHGTFCVSCHTAAPYAVARPALRAALKEAGPSLPERTLHDNVVKRVRLWKDVAPFYSDQRSGLPKTSESRGTEAVLNALVLATRDAEAGTLSDDARSAFANMWTLQMRTGPLNGAWPWLNFHYEPWEADNGAYFGATLAAIAVGSAPGGYAVSTDASEGLGRLRSYLAREHDRQNLFNKLKAVWASQRTSDLITADQRRAIEEAALTLQRPDGGWSVSSLGEWKRTDNSVADTRSDGYATAMVVLALQHNGAGSSAAAVSRGLEWLRHHQDPKTGQWPASSLNKQRDPATPAAGFMSDAATAFAVLALTPPAR
jgi:squalene-hopene/tetraprenyl-beta-curcumene cyclase